MRAVRLREQTGNHKQARPIAQCGKELETLRALGLFTAEFDVTIDDSVPDAESSGYGRSELPEDRYEGTICLRHTRSVEGGDADTLYLDAHKLAAWTGGTAGSDTGGLTISFYSPNGGGPEYAYVKYGPSGIGPCVVFGSGCVPE